MQCVAPIEQRDEYSSIFRSPRGLLRGSQLSTWIVRRGVRVHRMLTSNILVRLAKPRFFFHNSGIDKHEPNACYAGPHTQKLGVDNMSEPAKILVTPKVLG